MHVRFGARSGVARGLCAIAAAAFLMVGIASAETNEMPEYAVISTEGAIEVRDYPPMIVAEVMVKGAREPAITQGFTVLAAYIFGANAPAEKIAMTAPVTQQPAQSGTWNVHFMMPSRYTLASLPEPKDRSITLRELDAKRYATIRFPGDANVGTLLSGQEAALREFIDRNKLSPVGPALYAFYDPPWIAPEQRRNEIHIEISK